MFGHAFTSENLENRVLESLQLELEVVKNIEDIDLQILNILQGDCRLSFNKLAKKLEVSVGTAFNHVKRLEKRRIIKGYTLNLDFAKIGFSLTVIVMIQAEGRFLNDVENELSKSENIIAVYDITGDYDAVVIAKFKDRTGLNAFIKNLLSLPHVKRTATHLVLNVIKEGFGIKL